MSMTICISAIAKDEQKKEVLVFSTDHMVSTPVGQFDHKIKKYKKLNNAIAMLSGRTLLFDECIKGVKKEDTFSQVKERIFRNMKSIRNEAIRNEVYNRFNINSDFVTNMINQPIQNPIANNILETISGFNLETSIMLIGFDENNNAQISEINENGMIDFRDIQFHSIGSGTVQALNTLLFQRQHCNEKLSSTIYNVFKAKKNAEVSEGVGKETEILILKNSGECNEISEDDIQAMVKIYDEELEYGKNHKDLNNINPLNKCEVVEDVN